MGMVVGARHDCKVGGRHDDMIAVDAKHGKTNVRWTL